jgi:DNA end-binding protein Ku
MPQGVWVGSLSFGLVNIPVRLYAATSPKRVRFHQYEAGTGRRIRYRRVAEGPGRDQPLAFDEPSQPAVDDELPRPPPVAETPQHPDNETEVGWEDVVRGYEVEPGRIVTVDAEDLESVAPERSRILEVEQFVDLRGIDPVHFEKSYYIVPQHGAATERPYWLLYRAMEETEKVAIGRFVMRTKEYLVAVRPAEHVLMLETLFYADEVRDPKEMWVPSIEEPSERELRLAHQFVESLGGEWEPDRHRDEHRERLLALIRDKAGDATIVPETGEEPLITPAIDLIDALKASVDAAKRARQSEGRAAG